MTAHERRIKTWADMLSKPFTVGGEGTGSDPDVYALMLKNVFGVKLRSSAAIPAPPRWRSRSSAARSTAARAGHGPA